MSIQRSRPFGRAKNGQDVQMLVSSDGAVASRNGFLIPYYDAEVYTYTGEDVTTIVYKTGGIAGTTVATMTLIYSGGKCTSRAVVLS
jgi:phage-related minor tail protein